MVTSMNDLDYELETLFEKLMGRIEGSSSRWVLKSIGWSEILSKVFITRFFKMKDNIKKASLKAQSDVDKLYNELNERHKKTEEDSDIIGGWVDIFPQIEDEDHYEQMVDKYTGHVYKKYFNAMKDEIETIEYTLYDIIDESARGLFVAIFEE